MERLPEITPRVRHLVAGGLLAVVAAVAIGWVIGYVVAPFLWKGDRLRDGDAFVAAPEPPSGGSRRAIDGLPAASSTPERLVALMVENHEDARPLSGIARASLVFEAPVEGGITRLLAVYPESEEVGKIGPVRSARPYYLDWAGELDALYGHVGGSPEALARIKAGAVRDLDQFWNGQYYWRSADRPAPHNVYTSTQLLRRALDAEDAVGAVPLPSWRFGDEVPAGWSGDAVDVVVPFSTSAYAVRWRYDPAAGLYVRSVGGSPAVDGDGAPERAANVAVIFVGREVLDGIGRLRLGTVGSGRGILIRDGKAYDGVWRKDAARARLGLFLADGEDVVWKPGTTWIEAVPTGTEVAIGPAAGPDQLVLPYSP